MYIELGKYTEAVSALERAMELDPDLVKATYNLAHVYIEGKEPEKAITIISDLLKREPENGILLETLAYAKYKAGEFDEALALYEDILERDPHNKNALFNASVLLMNDGEHDRARTYLETLSRIDTSDDVVCRLGLLELATGNMAKAIDYLSPYVEKKPNDAIALEALGDALAAEEYYDEALVYYDKAVAAKDKNPNPLFSKARIYLLFFADNTEGMNVLKEAVNKGFNDREKALALLEELESSEIAEEIREFFISKKIIPSEETEEKTESQDSGQETAGGESV